MIYFIIIAVIAFFVYNSYKGNQDLANVNKYGGLKNKYSVLIEQIMTNKKLQLQELNPNNVYIGYSFIGNGYVRFKLIEMSKKLQVSYESKDMVDGVQKLLWKFDENEDQNIMFAKITKDLVINNIMKTGASREEALRLYEENYDAK